MELINLGITAGNRYTSPGCEWDNSEFSLLSPNQRLHHLMTCGVYAVEPDKASWLGLQIAAILILIAMKLLGAGVFLAMLARFIREGAERGV